MYTIKKQYTCYIETTQYRDCRESHWWSKDSLCCSNNNYFLTHPHILNLILKMQNKSKAFLLSGNLAKCQTKEMFPLTKPQN